MNLRYNEVLGKNQAVRAMLAKHTSYNIQPSNSFLEKWNEFDMKHNINYSLIYAVFSGVLFLGMLAYAVAAGLNQ